MRFFASAAAPPSAAATGLARDAKRGCCGAKRPLATATSSAQLKANMICAFFFAQITATRGLSAAKGHHASKSPAYWLALPGPHESVLTAHEAASLSTAFSKNLVSNTYPGRGVARALICIPKVLRTVPGGTTEPSCSHICTRSVLRVQRRSC